MADAKTEKQKVKEITDKLEEGLKELFESEKYRSYLSTMSKFHNYSFNNTLLIAMQKPETTLVAGYKAWQKNFNRHVNKVKKGIRILAPASIGFEDIPGDSKGYFSPTENRITVQEGMSESQTLKTKVHETAHSMLHNKEVNKEDILALAKDRNTKEVEAESIAYVVYQHFGIDTSLPDGAVERI